MPVLQGAECTTAFSPPPPAHTAWLRTRGLIVAALLYADSAALVLCGTLAEESSHASITEVTATLLVAASLVAGALVLARRRRTAPPASDHDQPPAPTDEYPGPRTVLIVALAGTTGYALAPGRSHRGRRRRPAPSATDRTPGRREHPSPTAFPNGRPPPARGVAPRNR